MQRKLHPFREKGFSSTRHFAVNVSEKIHNGRDNLSLEEICFAALVHLYTASKSSRFVGAFLI